MVWHTTWETKATYPAQTTTYDAKTIINTIKNEIRREFLREYYLQHWIKEKHKKKLKYLTTLYEWQICDINFFYANVCDFEKYYYKAKVATANQSSLNFHNDMFFTKLPFQWSELILSKRRDTEWPNRVDTLGTRIEFARMTLAYECEKAWKCRRVQKLSLIHIWRCRRRG